MPIKEIFNWNTYGAYEKIISYSSNQYSSKFYAFLCVNYLHLIVIAAFINSGARYVLYLIPYHFMAIFLYLFFILSDDCSHFRHCLQKNLKPNV